MKKILVHLHLYYHDQADYFISKLKNISGAEWDLIVTYSTPDEVTFSKLRAFKPTVIFKETENVGYDIWPFIKVVRTFDLTPYDYVLKLHTKRSITKFRLNVLPLRGYRWRDALVDAILYDKKQFRKVLQKFEGNKRIGMVSSLLTRVKQDFYDEYVIYELQKLGLTQKDKYSCMGTMFMIRKELLDPLTHPHINLELFKDENPKSGSQVSIAHIYERILSQLPINKDSTHWFTTPKLSEKLKIKIAKALEPALKFIVECDRKGPERRKYVKILGITVYESKTGTFNEDKIKLKQLYD